MLTHSDQFVPDMMQATTRISYEGMAAASSADSKYRIGVTVNNTDPSVSLLLQNWLDADGSASGRGKPTLLGSIRSNRWWQYDSNCTARTDWSVWLCDWTPGRYVASAFFTFNKTAQAQTIGAVGDAYCSNGNTAVPCPDIGTVTHVGHGPGEGMPFSMNTKITGPSGGFGWFVAFTNGTPPVLNMSSIQMRPQDNVTIVLPYPSGTRFNVTAQISSSVTCPASCTPANKCLCRWPFSEVNSPEAVRSGPGDTYHFSGQHLYLRLTPQSSSNIGVNGKWGIPSTIKGFSRQGIELAPRTSHVISIVADCPVKDPSGRYCAPLPSPVAYPATPCPSGIQTGIDTCAPISSTPTVSGTASFSSTSSFSSSGTISPTLSATPSLSRSGTSSVSASSTKSGTGSVSGTASQTASLTAAPTQSSTSSASWSSTGSVSSSSTSSVSATSSLTAEPTTSSTVSGTPSLTGSLTGSRTGSSTAASTASPSVTAPVTRSGSRSLPPSVSAAVSRSALPTATASRSRSRSRSAGVSLSRSGSATRTRTRPATPTRTRKAKV